MPSIRLNIPPLIPLGAARPAGLTGWPKPGLEDAPMVWRFPMPRFSVPDMHCDSCVRAITEAVRGVDPGADLRVDLTGLTVEIESSQPDAALADAIDAAGFTVHRAA
jgi:copper chaperone